MLKKIIVIPLATFNPRVKVEISTLTLIAIIATSALLSLPVFADCPVPLQPILEKIGPEPKGHAGELPKISEFDAYQNKIWFGHIQLAEELWTAYAEGRVTSNQFDSIHQCVQPPLNENDLAMAINRSFLNSSWSRIKSINPKKFDELSQANNFSGMIFLAFDPGLKIESRASSILGKLPAGFNDASKTVLANIARVPFDEWDITFIHEIGHFLDNKIVDAHIIAFNDEVTRRRLTSILKSSTLSSLTQGDADFIDEWLTHALNIGMLAEWRVWSFTAQYLGSNFFIDPRSRFAWLSPYLKLAPENASIQIFRFLDRRFVDPETGVYSNPIVSKRLKVVREKIRRQILGSSY